MAKAKPSDLGKGAARKAADAIVNRKKKIDKAVDGGSGYTSPPQSAKTSSTLDWSQKGKSSANALEKARADMMSRKKAKKK